MVLRHMYMAPKKCDGIGAGVQKKEPRPFQDGVQIGDDILSQACGPVPSALVSLTSLFGMGRGGPNRYNHLKKVEILIEFIFL